MKNWKKLCSETRIILLKSFFYLHPSWNLEQYGIDFEHCLSLDCLHYLIIKYAIAIYKNHFQMYSPEDYLYQPLYQIYRTRTVQVKIWLGLMIDVCLFCYLFEWYEEISQSIFYFNRCNLKWNYINSLVKF